MHSESSHIHYRGRLLQGRRKITAQYCSQLLVKSNFRVYSKLQSDPLQAIASALYRKHSWRLWIRICITKQAPVKANCSFSYALLTHLDTNCSMQQKERCEHFVAYPRWKIKENTVMETTLWRKLSFTRLDFGGIPKRVLLLHRYLARSRRLPYNKS